MPVLPDPKVRCPATGFTKSCRDIVAKHECPKFVSIRGTDPQTGAVVDKHGCVDSFLPMLLIENTQQTRQTGAAVESFRNEVVKADQERADALRSLLASGGAAPRYIAGR
jgi:hypothetical protein